MKLSIDPDWLRWMAKKEDGKIISVGGWVVRAKQAEQQSQASYTQLPKHDDARGSRGDR